MKSFTENLSYFFIFFFVSIVFPSVKKTIIEQNNSKIIIDLDFDAFSDADLYPTSLLFGLPDKKIPITNIQYYKKSKIPFKSNQDQIIGYDWINFQKLKNLNTGTLRISPLSKDNHYYKKIRLTIDLKVPSVNYRLPNNGEISFLKNRLINWDTAKKWFLESNRSTYKNTNYPQGTWYQFFTEKDGLYSISYETLSNTIENISNIDPRSISIFLSSDMGRSRTQNFDQEILDNLLEIPLYIDGEDDGVFNSNDKIIFYGRGPSGFDFNQNGLIWNQNLYFNKNSCMLLVPYDNHNRGKRVLQATQPESGVLIDYGIVSNHIEFDLTNLSSSGIEWLDSPIGAGTAKPIILQMNNPKSGASFSLSARLKGHAADNNSTALHQIKILQNSLNGNQIGQIENWTGNSFRTITANNQGFDLVDGANIFYLLNSTNDQNSLPYLDYFQIEYAKKLNFDETFTFTSPINDQNIRFDFEIQNPDHVSLWDVSDPINILNLEINETGLCDVQNHINRPNRFIIFNKNEISAITNIYLKENQSFNQLRNVNIQADYVIIGPEQFKGEALELLDIRSPSIYASIETVYDEFAAGNQDPMAIRSFIQWTQEYWRNPSPNHVLLLGDGGYDYRNINGISSIIVPTIQVQASRSYATDDLLASIYGNIPEVALGRYPAKNIQDVSKFIEKIKSIEITPTFGPWRQKVTLIADDAARPEPNHGSIATGQSHTINSEQLADLIPPSVNIEKLYMMEFPEVNDASAYGVIKPDATESLFNTLKSGTAIISYIGHGSPYQLAQEKLLDLNRGDINQINTGAKLPLWIVGTCSFGWFDDPVNESFSEELIKADMNCASMVISTTRAISVVGNERYTKDLFEEIFDNGKVSNQTVGTILQSIKDGTSESQYFHLFGDPGMKIPMPKDTLLSVTISPDTLKTLEKGTFYGNQMVIAESGDGYVSLIDADRHVVRSYDVLSETYSLSYSLPGASLFRGQFSFSGSSFEGDIRIPLDISYSNDLARLIIYLNDDNRDLIGVIKSLKLEAGALIQDIQGPNIVFETINGQRLEQNDHLVKSEDLVIRISDPIGINLTNEVGHEIILTDLSNQETYNKTNQFSYDKNSIITGTLLLNSSNEKINIKIKAWDNANNPSEKSIKLNRSGSNLLKIYNIYNFPNPFSDFTQFTFELSKNSDIEIDIFSLGGKKIFSFEKVNAPRGFNIINWNGQNSFGDFLANGVYIYHIRATTENEKASSLGRIAKFK
ncbi:MAG: type IX secretion system sortase PorU [Candidatus Neomarinimicrobiota bacterium]